jgi:lipopolysaccharide transport system ATP-binding protein
LNEGSYRIELIGGLFCQEWLFKPQANDISLHVKIGGKLSNSPYFTAKRPGILAPIPEWEILRKN